MKLFIISYSNLIGNYNLQMLTLSFYREFIEQYNNLQKSTGGKKLNKTKNKRLKIRTKQTKKHNKNKK